MTDMSSLVKELTSDVLRFQLLSKSLKSKEIKGRKGDKHSQITFLADIERMDEDQEAVIIWTTVDKFNAAVDKVKAL